MSRQQCYDSGFVREIPLSDIQDAARSIYDLVVRTPLVRLELPRHLRRGCAGSEIFLKLETLQPIGSFKIRGAHNVIRQLHARTSCATASGPSAPATRRRAWRSPRAHAGVPLLRDGDGHGAGDEARRDRTARRDHRAAPPTTSAGGPSKRMARDRMRGRFVHPFDDDRFIAGNGTVGLEILEDLPDVDAVDRRRSAAAGCWRASARRCARCGRTSQVFAAEPETAAPLRDVAHATAARAAFEGWQRVVRRRRRRQVGAADDVAAAVAAARRLDRRVAGRGRGGDEARRRARVTSSPKARPPAPSPPR